MKRGPKLCLLTFFVTLASCTAWPLAALAASPVLNPIANMSVCSGATADQAVSATDADGDSISFTSSGPAFMTLTPSAQVGTTRAGNIHLAPSFGDGGAFPASVTATSNGESDNRTFMLTVTSASLPPVFDPPSNMTVDEGTTADRTLTGSDACGLGLTFSKVAGPTYMTVFTVTVHPSTGRVHLAPGFADAGSTTAIIRASNGTTSTDRSFTITVNNVTRPPTLNQPANMTVEPGTTTDQTITATDPDGHPLAFAKESGPTFMTVTTVTPGSGSATGNIHLAAGITEPLGTSSAAVSVGDGTLTDSKPLMITVGQCHGNPALAQPANMTVHAGSTADQGITGTDACGNPLSFTKVAGPAFMTVFTTNPGTGTGIGDIHLAPGLADVGSYSATVRVSNGSQLDDKSFAIQINPSGGGAPTLAQPANMTVTEGTTADQILTGTDPDGDPLTFGREAGPVFMTVFDLTPSTGDLHLAPGFADAGIYRASVRASDGIFSDAKSLTITVDQGANRCPVSEPGGPYSGFADVPIAFDGSASSDPDGDPLYYAWDFDARDGVGVDALGPTASHTFASDGSFVITLQVSDLGCTVYATTTASIAASCPVTVFNGYDVIRLGSGRPTWSAFVQPASGCYANTDVMLSSFVLKYAGNQIPADVTKSTVETDKNGDGIQELRITFSKENLRTLFTGAGLGNGHNLVTVTIQASLVPGGLILGTTQVDAFNNGSFSAPTVAPNPLNPEATLTFTTSGPGAVKIELYDVGGRLVRTILDEPSLPSGAHEARIDGRGSRGEKLASGIYFVRGVSLEGAFTKTVAILK
ncbi:MAG TPA: PKD domain-containing protein [Candidatus Binatia bacterium]|nr:PKD domain-containing protein [Candidatus Binatia bacterium]